MRRRSRPQLPAETQATVLIAVHVAVAVAALVLFLLLSRRSKRRTSTTVPPSGEFDYIVVGGGLAGSVLAARLSEDASKRVLVVEAGESSPDSIFIRISGAILKLFRNPAFDWCWQTVAEAGCLGRRVFLCRGKLLGGSACLNAQLTFRGAPRDYGWGEGWSADELAATFDSIELRQKEPMGSCGMHVQLPNYQHELSRRFLGACGPDVHPDLAPRSSFNDWGDRYDGGAGSGYGRFELSQRDGTRWTAASSYLAVAAARPNVTVLTGHTVARVTLERRKAGNAAGRDARHLVATGVELRDNTRSARRARKQAADATVRHAVDSGEADWKQLRELLDFADQSRIGADQFTGEVDAIIAAATKLIDHHREILRDATDPEPRTQLDIPRLDAATMAVDADAALREVTQRLIARLPSCQGGRVRREQATGDAAALALARYLDARLQSTPGQEPGRAPDLGEAAVAELRTELRAIVAAAPSAAAVGGGGGGGGDTTIRLAAGGEVVLAAGALASPQLLMLSGIGDEATLRAAGVRCRLSLPAVGEGLQDHGAVTVAYECSIADGMSEIKPWMPYLNVLSPLALLKWATRGAGILSTTFCDHGAFLRSRPAVELPDVQLRFVPGIGPDPDGVKAYELLGKGVQHPRYGYTLQVINCRPKAVGSVRIASADAMVAPEVRCNYLGRREDVAAIVRGVAVARSLARAGPLGEVSLKEVYPGEEVRSDEEVEAYIRRTLHSANGLSGGCCIGRVVDDELRVHGVAGLRVADASVMPRIVGSQLALPTTAIAERGASFIVAAARSRKRPAASPPRRRA